MPHVDSVFGGKEGLGLQVGDIPTLRPQAALNINATNADDSGTVASFLNDSDEDGELKDDAQGGRLSGLSKLEREVMPSSLLNVTSGLEMKSSADSQCRKPNEEGSAANLNLEVTVLNKGERDGDDKNNDIGSLGNQSKQGPGQVNTSNSSTVQQMTSDKPVSKVKKSSSKIRLKPKLANPRPELEDATAFEDSDNDDNESNNSSSSDDGAGEEDGETEDFLAYNDDHDPDDGSTRVGSGHISNNSTYSLSPGHSFTEAQLNRGLRKSSSRKIIQANVPAEFATNTQLYHALSLVRGLRFTTLTLDQQRAMVNSITIRSCDPRDGPIVEQGDQVDTSFYIVIGPNADSEVVVTNRPDDTSSLVAGGKFDSSSSSRRSNLNNNNNNNNNNQRKVEREISHLGVGACFGERVLINPPSSSSFAPRAFNVRPYGVQPVVVGQVQLADFHHWQTLRLMLILSDVPLLRKLPESIRNILQERLHFARYAPGGTVFQEGGVRGRFYMLMRGEVQVMDQGYGAVPPNPPRLLANLGEGSCFVENSSVLDVPWRNATAQVLK